MSNLIIYYSSPVSCTLGSENTGTQIEPITVKLLELFIGMWLPKVLQFVRREEWNCDLRKVFNVVACCISFSSGSH